jgi:anthranilate phosphoribosyltransferase
MIQQAIGHLLRREDLSVEMAEQVMDQIMEGAATPAQIGGFLLALRMKGESVDEITGCARAMRRAAVPVTPHRSNLVDTCGTGGDGAHTFNISTTTAFVVAAAGQPVAKHGNRAVSSRSGSADVLQALGINLELTPEQVARCVDEVNIGFLFAPKLHPAMRHAIAPRRELGVRTIFNILGPLTNPAGADAQLMGVFDAALVEPLAGVLRQLGARAAFVVHGEGGLDELTTTGPNTVAYFGCNGAGSHVVAGTLDAQEYGFPRCGIEELKGGDADENAATTRAILSGAEQAARRDVVVLNAAAALTAGGKTPTIRAGITLATATIDSGAAERTLDQLIEFTQRFAAA